MDLYRKPIFLSFLWCLYIFVMVCARSDDGFAQHVKQDDLIKEPSQAAQHPEPDQLAKRAHKLAKHNHPTQPNQPSQSTQPSQPNEPAQPAQSVQPSQPNEPVQAAQSAQPSQPSEPAQLAQSTQLNEPSQPAQIAQSTEPGMTNQPAQSAQPNQPNEPAQSAQSTQPNEQPQSAQPNEPSQPAQIAQLTEPGMPNQPVQPNQPAQPSSSTNFRTPKTPPPPPMKYTEGEPQIMKDFFEQTFGDQRLQFFDNGTTQLSMDQYSGSGFKSKSEYIYLTMTMQIKLIPDDSAGAVTTFYLTSSGFGHDEIDIEFLGNSTGEPPTMHTNVYVDGKGNREQQFHLWFDPTADFHTYTLSWNSKRIAWFVDGIPIRQYKSDPANGIPYPTNKAQSIISSLWNADDWCTQGGRVKADWSKAPFIAYYKDFKSGFCEWKNGASTCGVTPTSTEPKFAWLNEEFDEKGVEMIKWAQDNLMVYNYCADKWRFPDGLPKECTLFP